MVGLNPENWGSDQSDYFNCFAKCLEENNAGDIFAAGGAWLASDGPHPKGYIPRKGESWFTSIPRHISIATGWGWAKDWANALKGRGSLRKLGKFAGPALTLVEGGWALGVEAKCAAECAGDSCSY